MMFQVRRIVLGCGLAGEGSIEVSNRTPQQARLESSVSFRDPAGPVFVINGRVRNSYLDLMTYELPHILKLEFRNLVVELNSR
jgi:hypothetical protein